MPRAQPVTLTVEQQVDAADILREAKEHALTIRQLDVKIDKKADELKELKKEREALVLALVGTAADGKQQAIAFESADG